MNDQLIGSDHPLSDVQREKLPLLLDTLLPASDDGRMPSASSLDFIGYLNESEPDFTTVLGTLLDRLDEDFKDRPIADRVEALKVVAGEEPVAFDALVRTTYACYYQDDRALSGIGMEQGPPFPRGNTIEEGDLSLLDPVTAKPRSYRKAD